MKRYMAILGFVFVGILAGLLVRGIPIVLHVNAGGEIPRGSQNGDVNGDSMLDMSDAVYLSPSPARTRMRSGMRSGPSSSQSPIKTAVSNSR